MKFVNNKIARIDESDLKRQIVDLDSVSHGAVSITRMYPVFTVLTQTIRITVVTAWEIVSISRCNVCRLDKCTNKQNEKQTRIKVFRN